MPESGISLMHLNVFNFMFINFYFLLYLCVIAYYIYLFVSLRLLKLTELVTISNLRVAEYWYHNIRLMLESGISLMHLNVYNFMCVYFYFLLYLCVIACQKYLIAILRNDEDPLVLRSSFLVIYCSFYLRQLLFSCSNLTITRLEKGVKCVQS